jgi:4-hydroxybenzoate polyprenyltransferase
MLMGTFLLAMLFVGQRAHLGWPYWLALVTAAGLFGWQQWLIRERQRDACLTAFRHNNWLGLTLWIGIVVALAVR